MSDPPNHDIDNDADRLVLQLLRGMDKRQALPGGAAREGLDAHLLGVLSTLAQSTRPSPAARLDMPPPRPIAIALALAIYGQPHLATTFTEVTEAPVATSRQPNRPLLVPPDILAEALGLNQWELDELQAEIDRRASEHLMRTRCLSWLTSRFDRPDDPAIALFDVLFPGMAARGEPVELVSRGAQLYALLEQERPLPSTGLFLPWLRHDPELCFPQRGTFRGRYVDDSLLRAMGRSLGVDLDQIPAMLNHMVSILPAQDAPTQLQHDHWRSAGYEALTALAGAYADYTWLDKPAPTHEIDLERFLLGGDGDITPHQLRQAFDQLAIPRVSAMVRMLCAQLLASLLVEPEPLDPTADWAPPTTQDLELFDLQRHMRRVLDPLLDWCLAPETVERVATAYGVNEAQAKSILHKVRSDWDAHRSATWLSLPKADEQRSVLVRIATHLVRSCDAIRALMHRTAPTQGSQRDLVVLFAAHYFTETPLERLWGRGGDQLDVDPIGVWFEPAWQRVAGLMDEDMSADFPVIGD